MAETDVVAEWQSKYIKIDELQKKCKEIDDLDMKRKEHPQKNSEEYKKLVQEIKNVSKEFMLLTGRDVDIVEGFFDEQMAKIKKQSDEIATLTKRAIQIQLEKPKCKAIVEKMQHTLGKISMLQNYTTYNQQQLTKLSLLHDESSTEAYDSSKWLEDKLVQTKFDDNNLYLDMQKVIIQLYSELFQVSDKKALQLLMESQNSQKAEQVKQRVSVTGAYFAGVSTILIISLINLVAYCYEEAPAIKFKLSKIQEMAIRVHFIIVTIIIGLGIDIYIFHQRKLNFTFICQIPGELVQLVHRNVLKIGFIQLCIVTCSSILVIAGKITFKSPPPIMFGQFVVQVSKIMPPTYWLLFPTLSLPMFTLVNIIRFRGKRSIFTYSLIILFKMFTPWRQRVEFPHFYFCNLLNSAKDSFKEIIMIIGCNRVPDYITIVFVNIFNIIRGWQSYLRWRDSKKFYNQGWNMIKYIISIVSSMNSVEKIKENETAYWFFTGVKALECVYKLYWDVFEDWGLILGGSSGKKYRSTKEQWTYGFYVMRPTHLHLATIILIHLYDYTARVIWIVPYFEYLKVYTSTFWYKCLTTEIEIIRRILWMLMRMDNQQSTNAEDYSKTKFIPVVIDDYERTKANDEQKQIESEQVLDGLKDLQAIFNNTSGKAKILGVINSYRTIKMKTNISNDFAQFKLDHTRSRQKPLQMTQTPLVIPQVHQREPTTFQQSPKAPLVKKLDPIQKPIQNQSANPQNNQPTLEISLQQSNLIQGETILDRSVALNSSNINPSELSGEEIKKARRVRKKKTSGGDE
ncbi:EXS_family protein [Hexamita inflata]|uniref:EXS family protein n=1 Tax=Hexamita inflata TaxID=28002 RepID=A0AA86PXV2_9EUKA|nr:EXS family protein [Hexamita inflata]